MSPLGHSRSDRRSPPTPEARTRSVPTAPAIRIGAGNSAVGAEPGSAACISTVMDLAAGAAPWLRRVAVGGSRLGSGPGSSPDELLPFIGVVWEGRKSGSPAVQVSDFRILLLGFVRAESHLGRTRRSCSAVPLPRPVTVCTSRPSGRGAGSSNRARRLLRSDCGFDCG
jgi:hypothetical protein